MNHLQYMLLPASHNHCIRDTMSISLKVVHRNSPNVYSCSIFKPFQSNLPLNILFILTHRFAAVTPNPQAVCDVIDHLQINIRQNRTDIDPQEEERTCHTRTETYTNLGEASVKTAQRANCMRVTNVQTAVSSLGCRLMNTGGVSSCLVQS